MVAPSPQLDRRISNTKRLLEMFENNLMTKDELIREIEKYPDQYVDLETYRKLSELKPSKEPR